MLRDTGQLGRPNETEGQMLSRMHAADAALAHSWTKPRAGWRALVRMAKHAWRNAVTRRELAGLDDRMLADIGLARGQALREADRFPWDDWPRPQRPQRASAPSVWKRVDTMWQRGRSRRRIAQLDATQLKDIGVTFADAEAEANKPFWKA
jgi:uncharacterized protein YjiS (DUF1127 family)